MWNSHVFWSSHVFKIIDKTLGGLLEVAPKTSSLNFLEYAKIKVVGLEGGFMDPILEILCQGLRVSLGIFPSSYPSRSLGGGRTNGLVIRVVRAEIEAESFGYGGRRKRYGIGTVNILETMKPLFVLGRKGTDDMAERDRAAIGKVDLLWVGSDKEASGKAPAEKIEDFSLFKRGR